MLRMCSEKNRENGRASESRQLSYCWLTLAKVAAIFFVPCSACRRVLRLPMARDSTETASAVEFCRLLSSPVHGTRSSVYGDEFCSWSWTSLIRFGAFVPFTNICGDHCEESDSCRRSLEQTEEV